MPHRSQRFFASLGIVAAGVATVRENAPAGSVAGPVPRRAPTQALEDSGAAPAASFAPPRDGRLDGPPPTSVSDPNPKLSSVASASPMDPRGGAAAYDAPPPTVASSATELAMLRAAEDAVRTDPRSALQLADDHAARFPNGMLVQESEVIAIEALVRLGMRDEARARAQKLLRDFPGTAHRVRVEALVGDAPSDSLHNP
jgi:hypothetical protein